MASSLYSDQVTNQRAGVLNQGNESGKLVRQFFSYTVPAATIAAGDTLFLCRVPKGARMLGGVWKNTAGGAAATGKIGKYTAEYVVVDDDWWGTLTDMTAATSQTFADTDAKHFGEELTADMVIGVLTAAQAIAAAAVIDGYVDYLL